MIIHFAVGSLSGRQQGPIASWGRQTISGGYDNSIATPFDFS